MIVLDTSAIITLLLAEEERAAFRAQIEEAGGALVSAVDLAAVGVLWRPPSETAAP